MKFFNPEDPIQKSFHNLPHWQQGETPVFVTIRLSDSLPKEVLNSMLTCREAFLQNHPQPWDEETEAFFHAEFSDKLDEYLDSGSGCCALQNSQAAEIVAARFHHFDLQRYELWSYVIMPNHAHILFSLKDGETLAETLQGWKGVSSRYIHKTDLCPLNPFWQADYFDRLVRNEKHFERIRMYIRDNPVKANLRPGTFLHWEKQKETGHSCPV